MPKKKTTYSQYLRTMIDYPYQLRRYNLRRYRGIIPTKELVMECVKKSGLSNYRFEIVYKLSKGILMKFYKAKCGMPLHYWHIFYEFDHLDLFYARFKITLSDKLYHQRIRKAEKKKQFKRLRMEYKILIPITTLSNKTIVDAYRKAINQ